jgi:hypothetical protein
VNIMTKANNTKLSKRYWKPFREYTIESVNEIFDMGDDELIRGLVKCVHSFIKEAALKQLLTMCESGEHYPAPGGSRGSVKPALVEKGTAKKGDSILSGEFSAFLKHGQGRGSTSREGRHGHGGERLK